VRKTVTAAEVAVFLSVKKTFHYGFSDSQKGLLKPGVRVVAPFRNRDVAGVFLKFVETDIELKPIKTVLDDEPLFPKKLMELALWVSRYYICGAGEVFKMIAPKEELRKKVVYSRGTAEPGKLQETNRKIYEVLSKPLSAATLASKTGVTTAELRKKTASLVRKKIMARHEEFYFTSMKTGKQNLPTTGRRDRQIVYTKAQAEAIDRISGEISRKSGKATLLFGITGSGKTEVYISLCEKALEEGGSAIILVPEIALTYQLVKRFASRFGGGIALLHSGLTTAQRRNEWLRAATGEAKVVIGARSAVFAPLGELRLIVVDEEHDSSYKQTEHPRYHARDVAVMLGKITGAAVVLGSATPSIETFHNTQKGKYGLCGLPERMGKIPLPETKLIPGESDRVLPSAVTEKLLETLNAGEQSLVFINRRGSSRYLKCSVCREVVQCPNCSISLTWHTAGGKKLRCHYCDYSLEGPVTCPNCGIGKVFLHVGTGAQKVESFLREIFPKARVERLDHDTAANRERMFEILERFEAGKTDILVGTQMTAKGHDFKNLTFSAIVGADDYLNFPDFRSAEKTFSLITQAAGRTGRGKKGGKVIVTSETDHYALRHAMAHDYESFYAEELEKRKITGYPPFTRLIGIMFESNSESLVKTEMARLEKRLGNPPNGVTVLGPVPALVYRLRNRYRWKILLKGAKPVSLHNMAVETVNTVNPRIGCAIDVDPIGFF